jgi:crotonobetainyl-CoA:carnitine CoA-transferase CaiB-like acyl-CoA transferase
MLALLESADVFITNWRPPVVRSLGLDDGILAARNAALIRVYVSGFGPTGPRADDPVFDTIVQARSGMTHALTSGDQPPRLQPGYPVDKYTGVVAAQAVLAALFARERRPGKAGERLDVAMLDATSYVNFPELFANRTFVDHQPAEARNVGGTSLRAVQTADGWIICGAVSGQQIRNACTVVGHPEWGDEMLSIKDAVAMVAEFFDRIESVTRTGPTADWVERFTAVDVPAAKLLEIDEHLADEQVVHNRINAVEEWEGIGSVRGPRYPGVFSSSDLLTGQGRAPRLGEQTDDILKDLSARSVDGRPSAP